MSRTQKRNRRRKEKRREKEQKTRAQEQGSGFFTIHESDSEDWHSVCSEELGYEDALSLHAGNSDDESSEQAEEDVAERRSECAETLLEKKGS